MTEDGGRKTEMTIEREVEIIHARQDEQGRLINQQGERLNIQSSRIDGLMLVVLGDDEKQIKGLLHRTGELERLIKEISEWRRDLKVATKIGLTLLGITGIGTWLPVIRAILEAVGG